MQFLNKNTKEKYSWDLLVCTLPVTSSYGITINYDDVIGRAISDYCFVYKKHNKRSSIGLRLPIDQAGNFYRHCRVIYKNELKIIHKDEDARNYINRTY